MARHQKHHGHDAADRTHSFGFSPCASANPSPSFTRCFTLFPAPMSIIHLAIHAALPIVMIRFLARLSCRRLLLSLVSGAELGPLESVLPKAGRWCAQMPSPATLVHWFLVICQKSTQSQDVSWARIDQMDTCPLTQVLPSPSRAPLVQFPYAS